MEIWWIEDSRCLKWLTIEYLGWQLPFFAARGDEMEVMQLLHARGARPDLRAQNVAGTADWGYLRYRSSCAETWVPSLINQPWCVEWHGSWAVLSSMRQQLSDISQHGEEAMDNPRLATIAQLGSGEQTSLPYHSGYQPAENGQEWSGNIWSPKTRCRSIKGCKENVCPGAPRDVVVEDEDSIPIHLVVWALKFRCVYIYIIIL